MSRNRAWYDATLAVFGAAMVLLGSGSFVAARLAGAPVLPLWGAVVGAIGYWTGFGRRQGLVGKLVVAALVAGPAAWMLLSPLSQAGGGS